MDLGALGGPPARDLRGSVRLRGFRHQDVCRPRTVQPRPGRAGRARGARRPRRVGHRPTPPEPAQRGHQSESGRGEGSGHLPCAVRLRDRHGRQSIELVVASVFRILADLLPEGWRPVATYFAHEAPPDIAMHHRVFDSTVVFGHEIDGIIIASSDLDTPNPLSNPLLRPFVQEYLELLAPATGTSASSQVRDLIATLLPTESCSASRIARSLGMDRRTLHRHLAASGDSYSSILDAVRKERAQLAIEHGDCSLTELAAELGFSELSAFSRWFRQRFGVSPRAWAKKFAEDTSDARRGRRLPPKPPVPLGSSAPRSATGARPTA
ncbi:helix-turn-helix domain-containing protein [Prescottella defluvii]|nr:helix-turn-helix domain-containing protein [Prescottella defluvii]